MDLGYISQELEDIKLARKDLDERSQNGIYEAVIKGHEMETKASDSVIYSSFTVWQENRGKNKGGLVLNLALKSTYWAKGRLILESMMEFATQIEQGDYFVSMNIERGYRHLQMHL